MAKRIVYVNPGDMIELRIIRDADLPRSREEWAYQVGAERILLRYKGIGHLAHADDSLRIDQDFD